MKHLKNLFFLSLSIVLITISCSKSTVDNSQTSGNWVKRSEFDGVARAEAVSFVIGDTAYIGTGYDGTNRLNDFWAYDAAKNFWMQKAQFPGTARNSAVGFSVGTNGYIATGYDGYNRLQDNWEYNQTTNSWVRKADLPDIPNSSVPGTGARYDAVAFAIGNSGYVCSGYNGNYLKDLWQFTPSTNTWVQQVSFSGSKRSGAVAFVYNNKAYVVTGTNNGTEVNDFWVYDPATLAWSQLRNITNTSSDSYDDDYSDIIRDNAVAFVINSNSVAKAYLATGQSGAYTAKTWEYDFATDTWARKTPYERSTRSGAISFAVKGRGFVGTGKNSTYQFDDFDEFLPDQTYDVND